MPFTRANGIDLYYEIHPASHPSSNRTPLFLIMGLALNSMSWYRILPLLSATRTVIIFDNRGTGRSSQPDITYSLNMMAEDAIAVLDAAGVGRAHVLGYSMGSLIAQEVALNYPHRVKGLVLGASTAGGLHHYLPPLHVTQIMTQRMWVNYATSTEMIIPILYSPKFVRDHPEIIREDRQVRLVYPTPAFVYRRQLQALLWHNTYNRLKRLPMPTLLVTGDEDVMVVPQNSKVLARAIPRSELVFFPGGGHNLISEQPEKLSRVVLDFLDRRFASRPQTQRGEAQWA